MSNPRRIIIGHANSVHDPAIALADGTHLFAEAVERHSQCKRGMDNTRLFHSWRVLRKQLAANGPLPVTNGEVVSLSSWNADEFPPRKDAHTSFQTHQNNTVKSEDMFHDHVKWVLQDLPIGFRSPEEPAVPFSSREVTHHLAHAAAAVLTSPFSECAVMILDGMGELGHAAFYVFANEQFERVGRDASGKANSLGMLYGRVTEQCGFVPLEGEQWKLMGLAAYGKPESTLYDFFHRRMHVDGLNVRLEFDDGAWAALEKLVGGFRHYQDTNVLRMANLAHNFQRAFEDCVLELAQGLQRSTGQENLAFAGGCALNSSLNGKIPVRTAFKRLHVPMAPADDGNALGVVLYQKHILDKEPRALAPVTPYLGSDVDLKKLEFVLQFGKMNATKFDSQLSLCDAAASDIAEGKIIAWMQDRAEFGPRALGNRSILADPRPADMKERLNRLVKFREEYRPLAPSILEEFGAEYFVDYAPSYYMERTLPFREEVKARVPAVVHEDGTGRLQTVRADWNPKYHLLIQRFHQKTGVPLVLNTSFNVMGKPIVHSIEDAITVLFTTGLDALYVGPYRLTK